MREINVFPYVCLPASIATGESAMEKGGGEIEPVGSFASALWLYEKYSGANTTVKLS
jgi:hypothetical protein